MSPVTAQIVSCGEPWGSPSLSRLRANPHLPGSLPSTQLEVVEEEGPLPVGSDACWPLPLGSPLSRKSSFACLVAFPTVSGSAVAKTALLVRHLFI